MRRGKHSHPRYECVIRCCFCGLAQPNEKWLLTGPGNLTICLHCVTTLLKQIRTDEQRRGRSYPSVAVLDYSFVSASELRVRTVDILQGPAQWHPFTWHLELDDGNSVCMYRSPTGVRVRLRTDKVPAPHGWIVAGAPIGGTHMNPQQGPHQGAQRKPLLKNCAFCQQAEEDVLGVGVSIHAAGAMPCADMLVTVDMNYAICYECILLAKDTFEQGWSSPVAPSAARDDMPVRWIPRERE